MKSNRRRKNKKKPKKGIYVLPNLFTSASLFCGFYAIVAAIQGRYESAAIAILIACLLDGLDGKVARFTNTTSHFGTEYDSLSDLVAFGVAPGILAFQWALEPFGRLGWLASFMYVICGALRLARFNVQKTTVEARYFKGLPIPAAAGFIAALILFTTAIGGAPDSRHILFIVMIYVLSFLMVSTIDYFSFKDLELKNRKPFNVLVGIILVFIVIAYKPKIMLFGILLAYVVSGPVVSTYRYRKRRAAKLSEKLPSVAPAKDDITVAEDPGGAP
ncbi:MAG: CDP-diacylglycerol--serine O-phosphatidyltransferase [Deltaproteobacteria bacterium]|nr:CDP-diacylglycerol--serine O-phosphatidyltransferase [Deltaproteobacteria bacterium]MBW1816890.1 CDP-diacylglycerol--serine O-phosphatidyltransferase [Deltaproteobacteria bacterium]MBW2284925.1 CDP-diacylglycerol--serine O-phosphatidyltransferase [Deltaproteobacteria bacterium]